MPLNDDNSNTEFPDGFSFSPESCQQTPVVCPLIRARLEAWVKADRGIQDLYASCDPRNPTRVLVMVDNKMEMVELTRMVVSGCPMVEAKRFRVHGV